MPNVRLSETYITYLGAPEKKSYETSLERKHLNIYNTIIVTKCLNPQ